MCEEDLADALKLHVLQLCYPVSILTPAKVARTQAGGALFPVWGGKTVLTRPPLGIVLVHVAGESPTSFEPTRSVWERPERSLRLGALLPILWRPVNGICQIAGCT